MPSRARPRHRFWDEDDDWLLTHVGEAEHFPRSSASRPSSGRPAWITIALFGIDDLEQGAHLRAPQFVEQFGSFSTLLQRYGGPPLLKADLEAVKQHSTCQ